MPKDPICNMQVNEKNSFKAEINNQTYYFCSRHCLDKFLQQHNIKEDSISCKYPAVSWYKNKIFIITTLILLVLALSFIFPVFIPFRKSIIMFTKRIWWAILLGFALGGVIDRFVPKEYISHLLAKKRKKSIFYAVILGFLMSACSHGILALSIELHKKGASNPAVIAFLMASPWANFPLTIMLIGFFGLMKALYIIICALITALVTGFIYQALESKNMIEVNKNIKHTDDKFSIINDMRTRMKHYKITKKQITQDLKGVLHGSASLANMVLWWILIGMILASAASAYIPQDIFKNYMGPTAFGLLITIIIATILEVCSEGTAPLAFTIYNQTKALGNAFVFLMAGVVTDYTEIGLLWHNVGKRVALFLPIVALPQVIAFGILANFIFK